jgi:molybdopterin/thiamine biosynthesis adenylyltransferase
MGGAALQTLVRAGVGRVGIADFDRFEATNLNRQVFASSESIGEEKTHATREALLRINPELDVEIFGSDWVDHLDHILDRYHVVVNGMDDLRAGIQLYRKARECEATIVDAYTSPYPSVTVVTPRDPRPEERLGYPTLGIPVAELSERHLRLSFMRELSYVSAASTGIRRLDPVVVEEILQGRRPRSSFAPVVITAGNLMAFEAIRALLGLPSGAGHEGYLLDLWTGRIERPGRKMLMRLRRWIASRALDKATRGRSS